MAAVLGLDYMAVLNRTDPLEMAMDVQVINRGIELWREHMKIAVNHAFVIANGGTVNGQ